MKNLKTITAFSLIVIIMMVVGCKKAVIESAPLVSLSVSNVVNSGAALNLNTTGLSVANNAFANFTLNAGGSPVKLFTNTSPQVVYYDNILSAGRNEHYSLFLGGTAPSAVDAVLNKDNFVNYSDSTFGVRFVNLLPSSPDLTVNLLGAANGSEVSALPFKGVSAIKTYKGDYKNLTWTYEIRNASTGALVLSYGFRPAAVGSLPSNPVPRFKNVSLILKGTVSAPSILRTNHY